MRQTAQKKAFRCACLERLNKVSQRGAYARDKKLLERLYDEIIKSDAKAIMLYLPLKMEVDL